MQEDQKLKVTFDYTVSLRQIELINAVPPNKN